MLALLIRWQLAAPNRQVLGPNAYDQVFTMHGVIMIFRYAAPILSGIMVYDGSLLVTSWEANGIYHVVPGQLPKLAIQHLGTPAGISYDTDRQRILIPLLTSNEVLIQPWP